MSAKQETTNPWAKPLWLSALLLALSTLSQTQNSNWEKSVIDDLMDFQHKNRYSSRIIEPLLVKYGLCYLDTKTSFIVQDGQPSVITVSTPIQAAFPLRTAAS